MRFGELKVGDKFIFTYIVQGEEQDNFRNVFMKTRPVKDNYYTYNVIQLTGNYRGKFTELGTDDEVIPIG